MSALQSTPGPWHVGDKFVLCAQGVRIADASPWASADTRRSDEEIDANARLIAAAPDLYSVVEELEESSNYWSEYCVPIGIVDRLRDALAKARGHA